MKKSVKLLILVLVLGIAIGGYAAVKHFVQKQETSENTDVSVIAATVETEKVASLSWKYVKDEITLTENGEGTWIYVKDNDFTVDQSAVSQMLGSIASVSASRLIAENPKNIAQYGLDVPASEGVITLTDGTEIHFCTGNETISGEVYFSSSLSQSVYLVSSEYGSLFTKKLLDMVQFETVPTVDDIHSVTVAAKDKAMKIEATVKPGEEETSYTVLMGNEGCYLTDDSADSVKSAVKNLNFTTCVDYKGDYKPFGLDNPQYKITVNYSTNATDSEKAVTDSYVLLLSDSDEDGNCYACFEGSKMIYTVSAASLSVLTAMDADALCTESAES